MKKQLAELRTQQVESLAAPWRETALAPTPQGGWIRAVREGLGMSGAQLARRLGIARQGAKALERSEVRRAISLATLARVANALDADLVYALVPRRPLAEIRRSQARKKADRVLARVGHSMRLEAQVVPPAVHEYQVAELAERYVRESPRSLWNEDA